MQGSGLPGVWRAGLEIGVRLCRGAGSDDVGMVVLEVGPILSFSSHRPQSALLLRRKELLKRTVILILI